MVCTTRVSQAPSQLGLGRTRAVRSDLPLPHAVHLPCGHQDITITLLLQRWETTDRADTPGVEWALGNTRLTRDGVWRWDTAEIPRAQCTMAWLGSGRRALDASPPPAAMAGRDPRTMRLGLE